VEPLILETSSIFSGSGAGVRTAGVAVVDIELPGLGVRVVELGGAVCANADPARSTKADAVAISLLRI
jgi:hypothetical protein